MKKISIIAPVYNEAENLLSFYEEVQEAISQCGLYHWEIVFVNDGSSDDSWNLISYLASRSSIVKGIDLSRNFGKEIALTAGAEAVSNSDAVIFIDADLQHPPKVMTDLLNKWEEGYDIVSTKRETIKYSFYREIGSKLFYSLFKKFSDINLQPKETDFRLLDKKVLRILHKFEERTRFFRGIVDWMGFNKTYITFEAPDRFAGTSTFGFKSLANLAINSFTSFSLVPLRVTGYLGLTVFMVAFLLLVYMISSQLVFDSVYTPLAYFIVFNTLLFGVVLAALGLIALYIGHIHTEVVRRPLYIVNKKVNFGEQIVEVRKDVDAQSFEY